MPCGQNELVSQKTSVNLPVVAIDHRAKRSGCFTSSARRSTHDDAIVTCCCTVARSAKGCNNLVLTSTASWRACRPARLVPLCLSDAYWQHRLSRRRHIELVGNRFRPMLSFREHNMVETSLSFCCAVDMWCNTAVRSVKIKFFIGFSTTREHSIWSASSILHISK